MGAKQVRSNDTRRLETRLRGLVGKAVHDYRMIGEGDRIMACVSGGKDSYVMLDMLLALQRNAPVEFEVVAVNLDQKQPGFPADVLPAYLDSIGIEYHVIERDTFRVVTDIIAPGKNTCGLCSRLRRGILYQFAKDHGFSRIALGHHREDIVETLFLNMFHGARLGAMPPKLLSDDGLNVVIRPLAYCAESDIAALADACGYPLIPCNLCGSQANLERRNVKAMLAGWEEMDPGRTDRILRSLQRVSPSTLADRDLFDFAALAAR